jgi:hypothetical protein
MDIEDLYHCVEKMFGLTANYAKGSGTEFGHWLREYHPGAYLFPIVRACGGTRQDCSSNSNELTVLFAVLALALGYLQYKW